MSNDILTKIRSTADILGGTVFFATKNGVDPEYPEINDLLANGMYIRLNGSDGSMAYISAFEIDKAIGIIANVTSTKAEKSDVDALRDSLDYKVSKTEFELLRNEVENKASKNDSDDLYDSLENKADKTVVENLIKTVNGKADQSTIDEIIKRINTKADKTEVERIDAEVKTKANAGVVSEIRSEVNEIKKAIEPFTCEDTIGSINSRISYLNSEIKKKLSKDDINPIKENILKLNEFDDSIKEQIDEVETTLSKKANTTFVHSEVSRLLNKDIADIRNLANSKADKSDVTIKANQSDVNNLTKRVNDINNRLFATENTVDDNYKDLHNQLNKKVNTTDLENTITEVNTNIGKKIDASTFNTEIDKLDKRVTSLTNNINEDLAEIREDLADFEHTTNNTLSELRSTTTAHNKQLSTNNSQLNELQSITNTHTEQLRQNWIRVLSTREYNSLTPAPDGAAYSKYYKYPNTLYFIVDFNKPKAIYIGDIKIAEAEQTGSVGFTYTFPIIF